MQNATQAFKSAWKEGVSVLIENFFYCVGMYVLMLISGALLGITVIGIVLLPALLAGGMQIAIKLHKGERSQVKELYGQFPRFWRFFFASIIRYVGVMLGLCLFVVPGIYLAVRWFFVTPLLLDPENSIGDAFRKSAAMSHRSLGWVFLMVLLLFPFTSGIKVINGQLGGVEAMTIASPMTAFSLMTPWQLFHLIFVVSASFFVLSLALAIGFLPTLIEASFFLNFLKMDDETMELSL